MDQIQQRANKERNLREAMAQFDVAYENVKLRLGQFLEPDAVEVVASDALRQARVVHVENDSHAAFVTSISPTELSPMPCLTIFEDIDGQPHPLFTEHTTDEELKKYEDLGQKIVIERYLGGATLTGDIVSGSVVLVRGKLTREQRIGIATQLGVAQLHDFTGQSDAAVDERLNSLNIPLWDSINK